MPRRKKPCTTVGLFPRWGIWGVGCYDCDWGRFKFFKASARELGRRHLRGGKIVVLKRDRGGRFYGRPRMI